jgi:hypothetical protein
MGLRGTRSDKSPPVARKSPVPSEPTVCPACRVVFWHKTWRRSRRRTLRTLLLPAPLALCPACRQVRRGAYYGRVVLHGSYVVGHLDAILRRIRNVAARARFTQPERRIVSIRREGEDVHVRTTSQKLAHRIARELEKAFHGRASYAWSGPEGRLDAVWERAEVRP